VLYLPFLAQTPKNELQNPRDFFSFSIYIDSRFAIGKSVRASSHSSVR
jgi:hypothetical protein